jgi:26S proteasome regulatory subunit N5
MQELQVETFGGMERAEKFDFILEQMRICLDKNDFVRGAIIAKKIIPRQLNKKEFDDEKLRFYALMIRIHARNKEYMNMCRAYLERYETEKSQADEKFWFREIKLACLFLILSPRDSLQSDLLHRIRGFKNMSKPKLEIYVELLKLFATDELIGWPHLNERFGGELATVVQLAKEELKTEALSWQSVLKERITEHNLRVVSRYYSRIRLQRLSELLDLSEVDTERKLAAMVSDKKALWAKIDRPAKIVSFAKPKDADATLNEWASNVTSLLDIVERTCHLVHRETMVGNVENAASKA